MAKKQKPLGKFVAFAHAKEGELLAGGVKKWESSPQDTREQAKAVMSAYLDGYEHKTTMTGTKPV